MSYAMTLDEYDEKKLQKELEGRRQARADGLCDCCHRPFNVEPSCRMFARHRGEV